MNTILKMIQPVLLPLLALSCGKSPTDSAENSASQFKIILVALRPTVIKSSTAQSNTLTANALCKIEPGERIHLVNSPQLIQSPDGAHYKIELANRTALTNPCQLSSGFVYSQHVRQEYTQVVAQPTATQTSSPAETSILKEPESGIQRQFIWPVDHGVLTSGYGQRFGVLHEGIDISLPMGSSVFAAAPGHILFAGWSTQGYGQLIRISHQGNLETRYGHNSNLLSMAAGKVVIQGDEIAKSGSSGNSTGPHLHFEIRSNGAAQDPIRFLPARGTGL